jgi:hypothetical protein
MLLFRAVSLQLWNEGGFHDSTSTMTMIIVWYCCIAEVEISGLSYF